MYEWSGKNKLYDCLKIHSEERFVKLPLHDEGSVGRSRQARVRRFNNRWTFMCGVPQAPLTYRTTFPSFSLWCLPPPPSQRVERPVIQAARREWNARIYWSSVFPRNDCRTIWSDEPFSLIANFLPLPPSSIFLWWYNHAAVVDTYTRNSLRWWHC